MPAKKAPTGVLGLAALAHAGPALCALSPAMRAALGVRDRVEAEHGFALTFDDGPHPVGTAAVLAVLARWQVKATFFVVGEQVERYPGLLQEVAAAGHRVGLHCFHHRNLLARGPRAVARDLARAQAVVAEALGEPPTLYRPPYGVLTGAALLYAHRRGWRTYLWSASGKDWERGCDPRLIAGLLLRDAGPGGVGLLHDADHYSAADSHRRTAKALPWILEGLASRNLPLVVLP